MPLKPTPSLGKMFVGVFFLPTPHEDFVLHTNIFALTHMRVSEKCSVYGVRTDAVPNKFGLGKPKCSVRGYRTEQICEGTNKFVLTRVLLLLPLNTPFPKRKGVYI